MYNTLCPKHLLCQCTSNYTTLHGALRSVMTPSFVTKLQTFQSRLSGLQGWIFESGPFVSRGNPFTLHTISCFLIFMHQLFPPRMLQGLARVSRCSYNIRGLFLIWLMLMCNRETEERNKVWCAGCSGWQIKSQLMTLLFARSQWMGDYPWDSGTGPRHADSVCGCDGVGSTLSAARGERGSATGWMLSRFQRLRHTSTPQTLMAEQLLECYSLHYTQSSAWCDTQRITPPTQQQHHRGAECYQRQAFETDEKCAFKVNSNIPLLIISFVPL